MKNSNLKKALANFNAKMNQDIEVINPEMVVGGNSAGINAVDICIIRIGCGERRKPNKKLS